jgi:DNA polymerase V
MEHKKSNCSGSEPFALQVLGDSMEPEFADKQIIIIDPSTVVKDRSYCLAFVGGEYIFRQLRIKKNEYYLRALNKKYPIQKITSLDVIRGIVTQRAGVKRSQHKFYG